jgi:hypothetical protein
MMVIRSLVAVVDDDESVRESLPDLLRVCPKTSGGGRAGTACILATPEWPPHLDSFAA